MKDNPTFRKGETLTARKLNMIAGNTVTEVATSGGVLGTRIGNKQTIRQVGRQVAPAKTIWGKFKSRSGNVYTFDQVTASVTGSGTSRSVSWSTNGVSDGEALEINGFNLSPWDYSLGTPAWQTFYAQIWKVETIYMFAMPLPVPTDDHMVLIIDDTNGKFGWDYPRIHA